MPGGGLGTGHASRPTEKTQTKLSLHKRGMSHKPSPLLNSSKISLSWSRLFEVYPRQDCEKNSRATSAKNTPTPFQVSYCSPTNWRRSTSYNTENVFAATLSSVRLVSKPSCHKWTAPQTSTNVKQFQLWTRCARLLWAVLTPEERKTKTKHSLRSTRLFETVRGLKYSSDCLISQYPKCNYLVPCYVLISSILCTIFETCSLKYPVAQSCL